MKRSLPITSAVALTDTGKRLLLDDGLPEDVNPKSLDGAFWMGQRENEWFIFCGEMTVVLTNPDMFVSLDTFTPAERVKIAMNNPMPHEMHDFRLYDNNEVDVWMWDIKVDTHPSFVPPWDGIVDSPLIWFALTDEQRVALANTRPNGGERLQYVHIACEAMLSVIQSETEAEPVMNTEFGAVRRMPPMSMRCQQSEMFREWMSRKWSFRTRG